MTSVFVSHSTQDRQFVEADLVPTLIGGGHTYWYSKETIRTADLWERAILRGLQSCEWFAVVLSIRSAASEYVKDEIAWAVEHRANRLLPILLTDCNLSDFHIRIPRVQYVDWRGQSAPARSTVLDLLGSSNSPALDSPSRERIAFHLAQRRDLFSVGFAIGDMSQIIPQRRGGSTKAAFADVISSLVRIGIGAHPEVQRFRELHRILEADKVEGNRQAGALDAYPEYLSARRKIGDLVRTVAQGEDYKYFLLGKFIGDAAWSASVWKGSVTSFISRKTIGRHINGNAFLTNEIDYLELPEQTKLDVKRFASAARRLDAQSLRREAHRLAREVREQIA